ncbi:MAG: hypothetical protein J0H57_10120 [Rhodospirillales bacterium]|nr:hypothetical protein [Rhodospirillales bacterium]
MDTHEEEKSPVWVNCGECGHEWVLFYTPIAASDVAKFSKSRCPMCVGKKIFMGRKPVACDPKCDEGKITRQIVLDWLAAGDTGISSECLAYEFLGAEKKGAFGIRPPADPSDLGRCLRLIARVPEVRKCVDNLGLKHEGWAKAAAVWDDIASLMEDEVGIDWSKGLSAPKTFKLMKAAGL